MSDEIDVRGAKMFFRGEHVALIRQDLAASLLDEFVRFAEDRQGPDEEAREDRIAELELTIERIKEIYGEEAFEE